MPLVTFIIPAYNVPVEWLKACIDSILAINLQPRVRQIVVVDDGSDKPISACLDANYLKVIDYVRQQNKGLSEARNTGLGLAEGEYVQFVDADDELLPLAYNHCVDLLKRYKPQILRFNYTHRHTDSTRFPSQKSYATGAEYMMKHNLGAGACAYIFKKTLVDDLRFTPGIFHEDEEFTPLLFLKAHEIVDARMAPYWYRKHSDSIVTSCTPEKIEKRLADFLAVINRLKSIDERLRQLMPSDEKVDGITANQQNCLALERRIAQATMDYLINVIRLRKQEKQDASTSQKRQYAKQCLNEACDKLSKEALFPLPKMNYTFKYTLFRIIANSSFFLPLLRFL